MRPRSRRPARTLLVLALGLTLVVPAPLLADPTATLEVHVADGANAPLGGLAVSAVHLASGTATSATTDARGVAVVKVAAGQHAVSVARHRIASGPKVVMLRPGETSTVALGAAPMAGEAGVRVEASQYGCVRAGWPPEIAASVEPSTAVRRARIAFRLKGTGDYRLDMVPDVGRWVVCLPRLPSDAREVTYSVTVETADGIVETPDHTALVVENDSQCPATQRVAPFCACAAPALLTSPTGTQVLTTSIAGASGAVAPLLAAGAVGAAAIGIGIGGSQPEPPPPASPSR